MARKKTVVISANPLPRPAGDASPEVALSPRVRMERRESAAHRPESGTREPPGAGPVGRTVYGLAYCLSYGVVFGAVFAGKCIPGSSLIGRGFRDGADSARRFFDHTPESTEPRETATYTA